MVELSGPDLFMCDNENLFQKIEWPCNLFSDLLTKAFQRSRPTLLDQEAFRDAHSGTHSSLRFRNSVAGHLPAVIDKPCRCLTQHRLAVFVGPFELH